MARDESILFVFVHLFGQPFGFVNIVNDSVVVSPDLVASVGESGAPVHQVHLVTLLFWHRLISADQFFGQEFFKLELK